ncbi:formin-like protein 3 [Impatiens glandulifera]|uniref:formin-like protein 3 n=1 Tax=Impatiens glandulifera TaxID=253017 RepID=UPI001FB14447|nr:formin-like protein 3 [Impatiens glandulifera]
MVGGHGTSVVLSQSAESMVCGTGKLLPLPPGRIAQLPPPAPPAPIKPPAPAPPPPPPSRPGKVTKPPPNCGQSSSGGGSNDPDSQKAKLKPFFWDKVMADPDSSMVWHELRAGSFQVDEEMMESLFGYGLEKGKGIRMKDLSSSESPIQYIQIIDAKKSQNLAILLKALNVSTEEVCDALNEGNELPGELVHTLLKMAPTSDEELKLRLFNGDITHLGPAERFLKVMVDIPFAFKRLESLSFVSSLQEDVSSMKETFSILEAACMELKNNRLFLKLLEAVLKTGNRMNDGTYRGGAEAFKLDTLLKLSDVKGADGKTTLLHFVVLEIIRSEGVRSAREKRKSVSSVRTEEENSTTVDVDHASSSTSATETEYYRGLGLEVVSGLSNELVNVTKAAAIDGDNISATVSKLIQSLSKTQSFVRCEVASLEKENEFRKTLENFAENAEEDIRKVEEEEKRVRNVVKETVDYFHGVSGKEDGLRLFITVRDFLVILEKVCKEVKNNNSSSSSSTTTITMLKQIPPPPPQKRSIQSEPGSPDSHQSNDVLVAHVRPRLFDHEHDHVHDNDNDHDDDEDELSS